MGAFSELFAFDHQRHVAIVVPALRARLRELDVVVPCATLDDELGARHASASHLTALVPTLRGGCVRAECPFASRCPLYVAHGTAICSEAFQREVQEAVRGSVLDAPPPVLLGRHAQWYDFASGFGWELGRDEDRDVLDVLPLLLMRLARRGAPWGWGDGGFGEGFLGWLSARESHALAGELDGYDLDAHAAAPKLEDPHVRDVVLPEMRSVMARVRSMARACAERDLGIALVRA